jgi:hypothetical protein
MHMPMPMGGLPINAAYLHIIVNHIPIILSGVGTAAALLALVVQRRAVWLYALASLTIAGASAYPVMLTGHAAEHVMKKMWYVDKDAVDEHEDAADVATWTLLAAGLVSAIVWWRLARDRDVFGNGIPPKWAQGLVLVTALAGSGTVAYAAYEGGLIVHGAAKLQSPPAGTSLPAFTPDTAHETH